MCSVKKGQEIDIPVLGVNLDKSLWGEDAMEFKYVLIHISLRRLTSSAISFTDRSVGTLCQRILGQFQVE